MKVNRIGVCFLFASLHVGLTVARAQAPFPFFEGFESGILSNYWTTNSTAPGRVRIITTSGPFEGLRHVALDSSVNGTYGRNELVLTVNLAGQTNVFFNCWARDFNDEQETMPTQFTGSVNADGIAISADGVTWHRMVQLIPSFQTPTAFTNLSVNLSAFAASRGLALNSSFKIKFQQYDNFPLETDGWTFDNIQLFDGSQSADLVVRVTDSADPCALGSNLTYLVTVSNAGPVTAENITLTNRFPATATLLSVQGNQGLWTTNGNVIAADVGSLAKGAVATYSILVHPDVAGLVSNVAQAATTSFDPLTANNRATETTLIDQEGGDLQFSVSSLATEENRSLILLTVTRTNHVAGRITVNYDTADGTATSGVDYVSNGGTLVFSNGVTNASFFISLINDSSPEGVENFSVLLSQPTGSAQLGSPSNVIVTIRDDDGVASFPFTEGFETGVLSNYWETYNDGLGRIQVTTNNGPHGGSRHVVMDASNVAFSLNELVLSVDLSGRQGVHLSFWHKRFIFENDDLMLNSFTGHDDADGVAVSTDGVQWFKVHGLTESETGTNEYRQFDIALDPILAANGLGFTNRVRIKFQQFDIYTEPNYGRSFDDIALYSLSGDLRLASPQINVPEGAGAVTLAVERVLGDSGEISVNYVTSNGTAQAGTDYSSTTGSLVFANGVLSQSIIVPILQDTDDESLENFYVQLLDPAGGAGLASPTQTVVTILDDDGPGDITFSSASYSESEDNGLASISIDRLYGSEGAVFVNYRTEAGSASSGVDYVETTGTLTFADGVVHQFFEVPLLDDFVIEGPESVLLFLQDPQNGASLGAITNAMLTIQDNEAPRASFPFYEGFESTILSNYWSLQSSGSGLTSTTNNVSPFEASKCLSMDAPAGFALNQAILTIDLSGQSSVIFRCWHNNWEDYDDPMPDSFTGSTNADGIAASADGVNWYRLFDLGGTGGFSQYSNRVIDLTAFAAQLGIPLTPTFQIKFQHYGSSSNLSGIRMFDHVSLTPAPSATSSVIRSQGFEGGVTDTWDFRIVPKFGNMRIVTNRFYGGTRSLVMFDAASLRTDMYAEFDNVDISSFNNVYLTAAFSASGPDNGDDLYLEISYDNGVTWNGTGSVKLVDGFSNANVPFGGTSATQPVTVATNPYTVFIPQGRTQIKTRLHFTNETVNSTAIDNYYVDNFVLAYLPFNQPPQLQPIGDKIALVSNQLTFTVTATDIDHDPVTLSASNLPPGAVFDTVVGPGPVSNVFQFTPNIGQDNASYVVTFTASDDDGQDSEIISIHVLDKVVTFHTNRIITTEDAGTVNIGVTLSRPADAVVQLATSGSATQGPTGDFTLSATTLVFTASGPNVQNVGLSILDDSLAEGLESTLLTVTNSPDVIIGSPPVDIRIRDNDSIMLASANLSSGGSRNYQAPGQRILQALQADVVAIQEFNVTQGGGPRAFVDENFGTNFSFYVEPSGDIPNGVISRWPILAAGEWDDPLLTDRDFVWATIDVPGDKNLNVICVHLFYSGGASARETEAHVLTNYLALAGLNTSDLVVVCGDFNTQTRDEPVLQVLTTVLTDDHKPADQFGDTDTNQGRYTPYDFVLPTPLMNDRHRPIRFGGMTFPDGVVFDTRIWGANGPPMPALASDSAALSMQHMAVMKLFALDSVIQILTHAGMGGYLTPSNPVVGPGSNQVFTLTADPYFHVGLITTNGNAWTPAGQPVQLVFVWSNITASGTLEVSFDENLATNAVPQRWLVGHNLTNQSFDAESLDDQDQDGFFAWQEYIADTDPTNGDSLFEIEQVHGSTMRWITFASSTARNYSVQYLATPDWTNDWTFLINKLTGSNQVTTVVDTNATPFRVYRIEVTKP